MLSLRDTASMQSAADTYDDPDLQQLLAQRMEQLSRHYKGDLGEIAHFLVVEPGDSLREIETELGFSPLENLSDGSRFGDPEFTPSWEWMQCRGRWFELVFILTDDGFGTIVLVSNGPATVFDLQSLCLEYADQCCTEMPQQF